MVRLQAGGFYLERLNENDQQPLLVFKRQLDKQKGNTVMLMQIKTIFGAKYIVNVSDAGSYTDSVTGKLRPLIEGDFITCHRDKNRFTVSVSMIGRGAGAFAIEEIVEMKLVKKGKKKFMKMLEDEFKRRNSTCT